MTGKHEAPNELQARASDPQDSAWVNANAGSGKTFWWTGILPH